jgi:hypothetical protein
MTGTQPAIDEVQATIKAAFPEAEFRAHLRVDPEGIYIDAYTKAEMAMPCWTASATGWGIYW